jgi:hypothetical protein
MLQVTAALRDFDPAEVRKGSKAGLALSVDEVGFYPNNGHDVATKLRCLCLCKVEMSLGSFRGSLGRRCGDVVIGAAAAQAGRPGS